MAGRAQHTTRTHACIRTHACVRRHTDVELKPGGAHTPVTPANVVEYVHRLADFRLNRELNRPANCFLNGFFDMVRARARVPANCFPSASF